MKQRLYLTRWGVVQESGGANPLAEPVCYSTTMFSYPLLSLLLGLCLISGSLSACAPRPPKAQAAAQQNTITPDNERVACDGLTVNDGDTFTCDLNHNGKVDAPEERVRLLGIEATEMHYSRKNKQGRNEPFAAEAKAFLNDKVWHNTVWLSFDKQRQDKYGRTLAYVYESAEASTSINEQLVAKGYATPFFLGANRELEARFLNVAMQAKRQGLGLYSENS